MRIRVGSYLDPICGIKTYVALAADHLVAVELGGESLQRGLNDTTTETEDQVQSGLLLNRKKK